MHPPFNDKKDKKAEFPDAFALAAILNWARKNKSRAYLLSKDNDWKLFADSGFVSLENDQYFQSIQELSSFVDLVLRNEEALKDTVAFADTLIEVNRQEIIDYLVPKIQNSGVIGYGDSGVSLFENIIFSVAIVTSEALQCDRESATYSIDMTCVGIFGFDVTDYSEAIWDAEDRSYRGITAFAIFQRQSFDLTVDLEIGYQEGLAENFSIIIVGMQGDFEIDYDEAEFVTLFEWNNQIPVLVCGVKDGKVTKNGEGSMLFKDITEAQLVFPQLNILQTSAEFTQAMGTGTFTKELRFETWILYEKLTD